MAVINKKLENNQDNQQGIPQPNQGAPVAAPAAAPAQKASSGRFTNVAQYMQANQGAGDKMAKAIGANVGKSVQQASTKASEADNIRAAVQGEKDRIASAGQTFLRQGDRNQPAAQPNATPQPNQATQQDRLAMSAKDIAGDEAKMQEFLRLRRGTGEAARQGDVLQQQVAAFDQSLSQAAMNTQQLTNEAGRMAALQRVLGRPGYTSGQRTLDQALLQVGGAKQLSGQTKDFASQLLGAKTSQETNQKAAQSLIADTSKLESDLKMRAEEALKNEDFAMADSLTKQANELANQRITNNAALDAVAAENDLDSIDPKQKQFILNELARTGKGFAIGDRVYDVDLNKFITKGKTDLTDKNMVDQAALEESLAIGKLAERMAQYQATGDRGPDSAFAAGDLKQAAKEREDALIRELTGIQTTNLNLGEQWGTQYHFGGNQNRINPLQDKKVVHSIGGNINFLDLMNQIYDQGVGVSANARGKDGKDAFFATDIQGTQNGRQITNRNVAGASGLIGRGTDRRVDFDPNTDIAGQNIYGVDYDKLQRERLAEYIEKNLQERIDRFKLDRGFGGKDTSNRSITNTQSVMPRIPTGKNLK